MDKKRVIAFLTVLYMVVLSQADDSYSMAIYYGDSNVNIGESFTIYCIVPVSEPIIWLKDGKKIIQHNLRHGKDDHAYIQSESSVSGEDNNIEAMLSVKHALKAHDGKYQCNSMHTNYHKLNVENNAKKIIVEHINTNYLDYFSTDAPVENINEWLSNQTDEFKKLVHFTTDRNGISFQRETFIGNITNNITNITVTTTETSTITSTITSSIITESNVVGLTNNITIKEDTLVPNYDNEQLQLKVYDIKTSLVLSCNITKEGDHTLIWEKNGTEVSKVSQLNGRYRIIKQEKKFIIDKTLETDAGLYSCGLNNEKKNITVVANVAVRVPSNTGVVEGEKLTIQCIVAGTDPKISWEVGNRTIDITTDRYVLQEDDNKIQNALFIIENASLEDRGEYKCIAKNLGTQYAKASFASDVSFVRVKGKMAALWPFLGICAEVFVLCAIILIYERRRNKTELEESDTDQNNEHSVHPS